jgi:ribosome modulation factor
MLGERCDTDAPMQPFCDGYAAGLCGEDPRSCPYDKMTKERNEWERGQSIGVDLMRSVAP